MILGLKGLNSQLRYSWLKFFCHIFGQNVCFAAKTFERNGTNRSIQFPYWTN